nr:hypothetical protein [Micromonospora sp. DSM 115978]
ADVDEPAGHYPDDEPFDDDTDWSGHGAGLDDPYAAGGPSGYAEDDGWDLDDVGRPGGRLPQTPNTRDGRPPPSSPPPAANRSRRGRAR